MKDFKKSERTMIKKEEGEEVENLEEDEEEKEEVIEVEDKIEEEELEEIKALNSQLLSKIPHKVNDNDNLLYGE